MKIKAKYLTYNIICCPFCGSNKLGDLGADPDGYTLMVCRNYEHCGHEFYLLTGKRLDPEKNLVKL